MDIIKMLNVSNNTTTQFQWNRAHTEERNIMLCMYTKNDFERPSL